MMNQISLRDGLLAQLQARLVCKRLDEEGDEIQQTLHLMQFLIQLECAFHFPNVTVETVNLQVAGLVLRIGSAGMEPNEYQALLQTTIEACHRQDVDPQDVLIGLIPRDLH